MVAGGRAFAGSAILSLVILFWLNQLSEQGKKLEVKEVSELSRLALRGSLEGLNVVQKLFTRQFRRRRSERNPGEESPTGWHFFSRQICNNYKMIRRIEFIADNGSSWRQETQSEVAGVPLEMTIHWREKERRKCVFTINPELLLRLSLQQTFATNYSIALAGPHLLSGWRSNEEVSPESLK